MGFGYTGNMDIFKDLLFWDIETFQQTTKTKPKTQWTLSHNWAWDIIQSFNTYHFKREVYE